MSLSTLACLLHPLYCMILLASTDLMTSVNVFVWHVQVLAAVRSEGGGSSMEPHPLCLLLSVPEMVDSSLFSVNLSTWRTNLSWTCCKLSAGELTLPVFMTEVSKVQVWVCVLVLRFPESFSTFSSFRKTFPMVSSYCYCSDSRGRELDNTGTHTWPMIIRMMMMNMMTMMMIITMMDFHSGLELLLSGVDDSAFLGLGSVHSFSQTNVYQVLQRRMLGVRLALTGFFRCKHLNALFK